MNSAAASKNDILQLDQDSIAVEDLSISALTQEISLQKRPHMLLVKMMNALEQKRQRKGFGWSRAWNKYGLNVFRTHVSSVKEDASYVSPVGPFLVEYLRGLKSPYAGFAEELLGDPACMLFTFYHNNDSDGRQYEGLTISLGRKVVDDKTKRDRLDIVLEDLRQDGAVDGRIDRVRIYVCPWESYTDKAFHLEEIVDFSNEQRASAQALYDHAISFYNEWKDDEGRQWSHWSTRFIDYFGPRAFIPRDSSFT